MFIDKPQGGLAPKRPRIEITNIYPSTIEVDKSAFEANVEMIGEPHAATERVRKYYPGNPELKNKRIRFLDKYDETTKPDGDLIELKLRHSELSQFRWRFLIVDDAHNARRQTGACNRMFQLLEWKSLV